MKYKSKLLLSENEIIECIKRNVLISAKDINEETGIADRTARRILFKLIEARRIEIIGNNMSPNMKYSKIIDK